MKNLYFTFSLHFLATFCFAQTEIRSLEDFSTISVSAGIQVSLYTSDENYAEVTTSKGDLDDLSTVISGNKLKIKWESTSWGNFWGNSRSASIKLYFTDIEGIDISSGASVSSQQEIIANSFEVEASSGSSIDIELDCNDVDVDISSGSRVVISGNANKQTVDISSGASYKGVDLVTKYSNINASSGASARVHVTEEFIANVSSGASIKYAGDPSKTDINDDKWSGGSIRKL